jgi:hypothetical protein
MKTKQLFESNSHCKTVFQRKNGVLRVLQIPIKSLDPNVKKPHPMFPIVKDRDEPTD